MMQAIREGKPLGPGVLRTNDTLRKDEWVHFDEQLVEEATIRLRGVADLQAAGLVRNVPNSMGKTVYEYELITDMEPATVSLDGNTRSLSDRQEFELASLPLPITHKDFHINLRTLEASRTRGEALDTTQVRTAGRLVAEMQENILFNGLDKVFGGMNVYGYTTHPQRNIVGFGGSEAWSAAGKTGEEILTDLLTMIDAAEEDRAFGPYWLYIPRNSNVKLDNDFKSNSDKTIRQRLLEVDGISRIAVADQLADDNIILVQPTSDVVVWVQGEPLQTVQWDVNGGFMINFKAFAIAVPLIRADASGRSGIVHMS
jgi:uncharacterized linocin/CFP29 family protein